MRKIENGIVFSNDIERILKGNNAFNFSYTKSGMSIPSSESIKVIRLDFLKDVNKIFENKVTILSEEEMMNSIDNSIVNDFGRYPHSFS